MKRTIVWPDLQCPYEDQHLVRNFELFAKAFKHDSVVTIGDEIDLPQISRWTENTPGWYEQTLAADRDEAVEVLWSLVEHSKEAHMIRSNHTDRLYNVTMKKIPAFLALPELRFEKFMKFDELGITFHKKPMQLATGWYAVHGDHTPIKNMGGASAMEAARRMGVNIVSGHTHRAGRQSFSEAIGGRMGRVLHGVEVGNLMDFKQAGYTKGTANWQQCFAIMYVHGKNVQVDLIYIEKNGTFIVQGKVYGRVR